MAKRMLALGTTEYLRSKYGDLYHAHIVHSHAPHTSDVDMIRVRDWVQNTFRGAVIEQKTYHGQLRFSVPAASTKDLEQNSSSQDDEISSRFGTTKNPVAASTGGTIGNLFSKLEEVKGDLGIQYYSVSQTSLDQVFLIIVGQHQVEEENSHNPTARRGFRCWRS